MTMLKSKQGFRRLFAYCTYKEVFDRMLALLSIVVVSPLMLLLAIAALQLCGRMCGESSLGNRQRTTRYE